jgi:hypothetical protein
MLGPREQIVDAENFVTSAEQAINQMRSKKSGATSDQNALTATVDACQRYSPYDELISIHYRFVRIDAKGFCGAKATIKLVKRLSVLVPDTANLNLQLCELHRLHDQVRLGPIAPEIATHRQ